MSFEGVDFKQEYANCVNIWNEKMNKRLEPFRAWVEKNIAGALEAMRAGKKDYDAVYQFNLSDYEKVHSFLRDFCTKNPSAAGLFTIYKGDGYVALRYNEYFANKTSIEIGSHYKDY